MTELLQEAVQELIGQAIEAELQELLKQYQGQRTVDGRRLVARSGFHKEREV